MFLLHQLYVLAFVVCWHIVVVVSTMSIVSRSVHVSLLTEHVTKSQLHDSFTSFGAVDGVVWKLDLQGDQTGIAYLIFNQEQDSKKAIAAKKKETWKIAAVDIEEQELQDLKNDQDAEEKMEEMLKTLSAVGKKRVSRLLGTADAIPEKVVDVKPELSTLQKTSPSSPPTADVSYKLKTPKLPFFSGDKKGKDSSFSRWQYHVKVLLNGPYDPYSVLDAIHQSLKSPAADLLLTMGPEVTAQGIMDKLRTRFGSVLSVDALTEKLYHLKQGDHDVSTWAFDIEEVIYQIEEKGGMAHAVVEERIKIRFWHGLSEARIKDATRSVYSTLPFDDLLVMCRTLQEEYATDKTLLATVHQQTSLEKKMDVMITEMKEMKTKIQQLETAQRRMTSGGTTAAEATTAASSSQSTHQGNQREKKVAFCTKCKLEGHLWFGCKTDDPGVKCRRCNLPGHLQKCCRARLN